MPREPLGKKQTCFYLPPESRRDMERTLRPRESYSGFVELAIAREARRRRKRKAPPRAAAA